MTRDVTLQKDQPLINHRTCSISSATSARRSHSGMTWRMITLPVLFAGLTTGCSPASPAPASDTGKPVKPPHRDTVSALGRIEPGEGVIIITGTIGDRVKKVLVKPGQIVRAGEQVVECLGEGVLSKQLEVARGKLEQARDMVDKEKKHAQALLAETELAKRRPAEIVPIQIEAQDAEIKVAENQLQQAERDLEKLPKNLPQAEIDRQTLVVDRYREQLRGFRAKLRVMEKEKEINQLAAEKKYDSTKAGLDKSLALIDVSGAERQVSLIEAELARATVLSPVDGQILEVNIQAGETIGQRPMITLGQNDVFYVIAEVYEADIARVKVGQKATITSMALAEPLEATVDRIGSMVKRNEVLGLDPTARLDTRVVEVRLRLDKPGVAPQRIGMQVDVMIATPAASP
jgi:HlyD family secretion protein